jgi:hypothetical protein
VRTVDWCNVARVTIDVLPDVALLEIFHFYVDAERIYYEEQIEAWQTLVHVCRNWRIVVFGSPHRLGLRLRCSTSTPVTEMLDVWPPLPIVIIAKDDEKWGMDNIFAALKHNDRICELELLFVANSQMEGVLAAMPQPFPQLARLELGPNLYKKKAATVPASFLGGSAPRLRALRLTSISFPGLQKLLLSATHLVRLELRSIPHSGYIAPDAMVTSLSILTRLENLRIGFASPRSTPKQRSRCPPTRTLLPVLTELWFRATGKYFEDFVAQINAPLLGDFTTFFFDQVMFSTPQLGEFISRTPKFKEYDKARVVFSYGHASVILPRTSDGTLKLGILRKRCEWQLSFLAQICSMSFPHAFLTVEHLYIQGDFPQYYWQDGIESSHWLDLLRPYTAVKDLYLSQKLVPHIAPVLQQLVGERVTEVLPALQALFLDSEEPLPSGPVLEGIEQFVAARQLAGHPIAVSCWKCVEKA